MNKIEQLTPEQEAAIEPYYDACLASAYTTEPADRVRAEAAARTVLESELADPTFVWVDSPYAALDFQACWNGTVEATIAHRRTVQRSGTLRAAIRNATGSDPVLPIYTQWGWTSGAWMKYAAFAYHHIDPNFYDADTTREMLAWCELADTAHAILPLDSGIVLMVERPCELHITGDGTLHNPDGASIVYRDGWSVYALDGVVMSAKQERYWQRGAYTPGDVLSEANAEVRRLVIHHIVGWDALLDWCDVEVLDDVPGDARLVKLHLPNDPEPVHMLDMRNHTCEVCVEPIVRCACGERQQRKRYLEGVPTSVTTVVGAHAWRWQLPEDVVRKVRDRA